MRIGNIKRALALLTFGVISLTLNAQSVVLDDFEDIKGWELLKSEAFEGSISLEPGKTGNAIRFDYDFTKGMGFGGIQKWFPLNIPDNYEFTFWIKAESPANTLEIKFIDESGDNVWWVNKRNYEFPTEWTQVRIRNRHVTFAWGPTQDRVLRRADRIEFTVASFVGGKGTIWIDDLRFEKLPPRPETYPQPNVRASSSRRFHSADLVLDGNENTSWQSRNAKNQHLLLDFGTRREIGGIHIDWLKNHHASKFSVSTSNDALTWHKSQTIIGNLTDASFVRMPETEARYLRVDLLEGSSPRTFGIESISILDIKESQTVSDFLIYKARHAPAGDYPRQFLEQAVYWTATGVNNDLREALICEDGQVEVDKGLFSIEPMLRIGNQLYNWNNVSAKQSLSFPKETGRLDFTPTVTWNLDDVTFVTGITAFGEANVNSRLNIGYYLKNNSTEPKDIELFLLLRPYQVNPYYQFLNFPGGAGVINSIHEVRPGKISVDNKTLYSLRPYDMFAATTFDQGSLVDFIRTNTLPRKTSITDPHGLGNGVIKYNIRLEPGEETQFFVVVPFHTKLLANEHITNEQVAREFEEVAAYWRSRFDHISFNLPESANRIINTYKANLFYILINRDFAGIQPGSRSYERSWIRDGSLTSSALLKSGITPEVREFIEWFTPYQYESGKVPCVVDFRGPDPVPQHDSPGQLIFLIKEYFDYTKDTTFLRTKNHNILKAVRYMEYLIAQRSTDHFRLGNDSIRAYYGIVPESISHEGYSAHPMHSYWDNFFVMKGLKDAVEVQRILGNTVEYEHIKRVRDTFRVNLYNSIRLAMQTRNIDFIPGCVELGDFDPTSTTIAIWPANEMQNLPRPEFYNTFERYLQFFRDRRDGKLEWSNYTPYETRSIGTFIFKGKPEIAHELTEFFLDDLRPQGWYHWAEVVWREYRIPRFIGDMPHTWVGSDFINAVRSKFVFEDELNGTLNLGAGLRQDWIDYPKGISVENLPTHFGEISYAVKKHNQSYTFSIQGNVQLPQNGIRIRNFNGSRLPLKVTINGHETRNFTNNEIVVDVFPAEVVIYY